MNNNEMSKFIETVGVVVLSVIILKFLLDIMTELMFPIVSEDFLEDEEKSSIQKKGHINLQK